MINNSTTIIPFVPAGNLDPFLLARSQSNDTVGFIMVGYGLTGKNLVPGGDITQVHEKFYDLLFFKGPYIFESARLHRDRRFIISHRTAFTTFEMHCRNRSTLVSLVVASEETTERFCMTF